VIGAADERAVWTESRVVPSVGSMGLVVRDAGEQDAADIARIGSLSMRAQYRELVDPAAVEAAIDQSYSLAALTTCMDRCTASQGAHFLVAELDDAVVGYLHFDDFGPEPELHRIYVDPDGRGHGVGAALLFELHSRLPARMPYMLLVMEGNDHAVAFYEHHGFESMSTSTAFPTTETTWA
jgi:ribosomal protein S18 acetylase RimI-like enzyme